MPFAKPRLWRRKNQDIACIPRVLLDRIGDMRLTETFSKPSYEYHSDGTADITFTHLQPYVPNLSGKDGCCFSVNKRTRTVQTSAPNKEGNCVFQSETDFGGYANRCPTTEGDARKLLEVPLPTFSDLFRKTSSNGSIGETVIQICKLSTEGAIALDSMGCGH